MPSSIPIKPRRTNVFRIPESVINGSTGTGLYKDTNE